MAGFGEYYSKGHGASLNPAPLFFNWSNFNYLLMQMHDHLRHTAALYLE